jgi:tetratricopeptide (TPR) repeat protein
MRLLSLLLIVAVATFSFACGGDDDYVTDPNAGDGAAATSGGGDPANPPAQEPPKREVPRLSPMAAKIAQSRKMVDAVRDMDAKQKKAAEQAAVYAGQSVSGEALFYLGELWRMAGEYAKAADTYSRFISECPNDTNAWTGQYYLAVNLAKAGRAGEGIAHVNSFAGKYPDKQKFTRSMAKTVGDALVAEGKLGEAIAMLQVAVDNDDAYAGEEMVRCLWATGKYDEARTKATKLASNFNGHTEQKRYDTLSDLSSRMGKPAAALDVEGWSTEGDYDTDALKGNVWLVYFWTFRNRGTANKNERLLTKLYNRYNGEGFEIIGISKHSGYNLETGESDDTLGMEEEIHNLKVWVYNFKAPWPLALVGNDNLYDFFGYRGNVPAIAVMGKKGNLRYFRDSSDEQGYAILAKVIEKLLDE